MRASAFPRLRVALSSVLVWCAVSSAFSGAARGQTCQDQGPGYQEPPVSYLAPIVRWKQYGGTLADLPKGPLPTQYGINIWVDGVAHVVGYCDDWAWNGQACAFNRTFLNTISAMQDEYLRPGETQSHTIFEFAINPNGTTASVQDMDSRDDTKTNGGPVLILPSGGSDSASGVAAGTYTSQIWSNVSSTSCDPTAPPHWITGGLQKFNVTDTDNGKDITETETKKTKGICPGNDDHADIKLPGPLPQPAGGAATAGNPCSARSGNKSEREVDYAGPVLPFVRTYSSLAMYDIGLGYGWSSPYHGRTLTPLGTLLNVVRANGHAEVFTKTGGVWVGDADTRYAITENAGGFILTHRDGYKETYGTDGKLLSESDPSGNVTTYLYDPQTGLLASVGSPYGHVLSFAYDASGHLQTVTTPGDDAITYAYTADNLTSVTYPDTRTRSYQYEKSTQPHKLTGITDESGVRYATFDYDTQGRATLTQHATTTNGTPQEKFTLTYNTSLQTTVTDPRGYQKRYTFSENLKLKRLTQEKHLSDNLAVNQTFDTRNNVLTRTDELGHVTTFAWNATNQMTSRTEASGAPEARATTFTYQSATLDLPTLISRPSVVAGQTATTTISYDPTHLRPTSVTLAGWRSAGIAAPSRTTTFTYNSRGQVLTIDGPQPGNGDTTTFSYYDCTTGAECGQLHTVTNPMGQITSYDLYDDDGRVLQMTDPLGTVTAMSYDPRGQLLSSTRTPVSGAPRTWSFTYDTNGQIETSTSPGGVLLSYEYDAAHDLRAIEDSAGNRVEYLYDLAGNPIDEQLRDPSGTLQQRIQADHDVRNRLKQLTETTSVTNLVINAVGGLTSLSDPNGHATAWTFDALDRVKTQDDALPGTAATTWTYQVNDALQGLTAPNGVATGYTTDDLGNPATETSPDRGNRTYVSDNAGNLITVTQGQGAGSFTYDALNRPLTRDYTGTAQDVTFTYDSCTNGAGRFCSITHEAGTTAFEYDAFGNVVHKTEVISSHTYHTYYTWDADDRLSSITYPTGEVVAYSRDGQGRIQGVTLDGANVVSNRTYRGDGKLTGQTYGNGLVETRTYNGLGLLGTYALGAIENETYGYDLAGNLTSRSGSFWTLGYGYDQIDRVTSDTGGSGSRSYAYDGNGNRLTKTVDGSPTTYTYTSGTNRLATVGGSSISTDSFGRTTAIPAYTYFYNAGDGRLQSVQLNSSTVGTYAYDASGLRRWKVAGSTATIYHYDESGHLLAETDAAGAMQRLYVWADASPIAQRVGSVITYMHVDHLDTPRWGTSATGTLVWRWRSDGFGEALPEQDVDGDGTNVVVNLRFPGQLYDSESGLHYNWMRDYQPAYGRYVQADPIGQLGGSNLYVYSRNSPARLADPTGQLAPILAVPAAGAAIGGILGFTGQVIANAANHCPLLRGTGTAFAVGAVSGAVAGALGVGAGTVWGAGTASSLASGAASAATAAAAAAAAGSSGSVTAGAAAGAAVGSAVVPGPGTVVGGVAGAVTSSTLSFAVSLFGGAVGDFGHSCGCEQ